MIQWLYTNAECAMLKLEPPYKDDLGQRLPVLLDILPDGTRVYEPEVDPQKSLAERIRRVFVERGGDFFDRNSDGFASLAAAPTDTDAEEPPVEDEPRPNEPALGPMTPEELFKMRAEVMPQLAIALGEMTHAKELLSMLLASAQSETPAGSSAATSLAATLAAMNSTGPAAANSQKENTAAAAALSATTVTKPAPILSVQAFNAQLTLGGKDEALRKAAGVFKTAAESIERARVRGERYWVDALRIRKANWGFIPAPLPFGAPTGKGADKTSKDFLISYGLEESPAIFRRRAVGRMPTYEGPHEPLVFPYRSRTRLLICVSSVSPDGTKTVLSQNTMSPLDDSASLDAALRAAQQEIVEQEIFSLLVKEAGSLPTASARVSERLIVIDAAKGVELKFELTLTPSQVRVVRTTQNATSSTTPCRLSSYACTDTQNVNASGPSVFSAHQMHPMALRRLYCSDPSLTCCSTRSFLGRLRAEMDTMERALAAVGIVSALRFEAVGGTGQELVALLDAGDDKESGKDVRETAKPQGLGGEAVLRIGARHTVRLTFRAPSSLTAHLSQATLAISSIAQLRQLLGDEVERCLLQRICEVGRELCEHVGGTWFIDLSRCVGRWEGNFRIFVKDATIYCSAFRLGKTGLQQGGAFTYSTDLNTSLLSWVEGTIRAALGQP
ncbi:Mediator of RNA polymerase II transcription subunit 17 [Mycena sanguinolenta]|uniref:Mediator of RNA polymerase II transcription subunit 17 n=1 Tax=Mycena sanguinolenta TaxID=230812 RepID=A0A8H6YBH5_9AGAR|nr:Mediator of RNA polymerase II transcription subunit 17 [Mycena sanguinolenta]